MYCEKCGSKITGGAFCSTCGAPINVKAPYSSQHEIENISAEIQHVDKVSGDPGKAMGTAALVLGIVGVAIGTVCSCMFACLGGIIPLACAIVGLVLGCKAMKQSKLAGYNNMKAMTGVILSIVAIVVVVVFICINALFGFYGGLSSL